MCNIIACNNRTADGTCGQTSIHLQGCAVADNVMACSEFYEQPEPEVVKCEVINCVVNGLLYDRDGKGMLNISNAPDDPDFIGFLYEDERLHDFKHPTNKIRLYMDENGNVFSEYREGWEVLTPTHVLFKGKK